MIIHYQIHFDIFQLTLEFLEPKAQEVPPGLISPGCISTADSKHIQLTSSVPAARFAFKEARNKNQAACMETFRSSSADL